ncbi:MAG: ribosome modulation factor [Pseudomonadota bacterium]|nr:ribosome modulation factor [Pseudomonadota bacterium]
MKTKKRDRAQRAFMHGVNFGSTGKPRTNCPFQEIKYKEAWLAGWREGRQIFHTGINFRQIMH